MSRRDHEPRRFSRLDALKILGGVGIGIVGKVVFDRITVAPSQPINPPTVRLGPEIPRPPQPTPDQKPLTPKEASQEALIRAEAAKFEQFDQQEKDNWQKVISGWTATLPNDPAMVQKRFDLVRSFLSTSRNHEHQTTYQILEREGIHQLTQLPADISTLTVSISDISSAGLKRTIGVFTPTLRREPRPDNLLGSINREAKYIDELRKIEKAFPNPDPNRQNQIVDERFPALRTTVFSNVSAFEYGAYLRHTALTNMRGELPSVFFDNVEAYVQCRQNPDPTCWPTYVENNILSTPQPTPSARPTAGPGLPTPQRG